MPNAYHNKTLATLSHSLKHANVITASSIGFIIIFNEIGSSVHEGFTDCEWPCCFVSYSFIITEVVVVERNEYELHKFTIISCFGHCEYLEKRSERLYNVGDYCYDKHINIFFFIQFMVRGHS